MDICVSNIFTVKVAGLHQFLSFTPCKIDVCTQEKSPRISNGNSKKLEVISIVQVCCQDVLARTNRFCLSLSLLTVVAHYVVCCFCCFFFSKHCATIAAGDLEKFLKSQFQSNLVEIVVILQQVIYVYIYPKIAYKGRLWMIRLQFV